jgi:hypothetical protein
MAQTTLMMMILMPVGDLEASRTMPSWAVDRVTRFG